MAHRELPMGFRVVRRTHFGHAVRESAGDLELSRHVDWRQCSEIAGLDNRGSLGGCVRPVGRCDLRINVGGERVSLITHSVGISFRVEQR